MGRVAAVVLGALVLCVVACRSNEPGAPSAGDQGREESAFRDLGKRDSSPPSAWAEGVSQSP
jgi:hypothetical protein